MNIHSENGVRGDSMHVVWHQCQSLPVVRMVLLLLHYDHRWMIMPVDRVVAKVDEMWALVRMMFVRDSLDNSVSIEVRLSLWTVDVGIAVPRVYPRSLRMIGA